METGTDLLKKFEIKLQSLEDQELLLTLQKLLEKEKRIGDAILLALKEIKARRIYAAMGYSSPFEMLVKHFHLSESSTYTRLQALKLMEAIPEVQADIASGDLSLSNAALVQGFIQRNEKEKDQPLTLEEKKEVVELVKKKSTRDAKVELAKKDPEAALLPVREKPLALNLTQLQIIVDAETMETLNEVKQLLSHSIPDGNLKEVLKYMISLTAQTLRKRKGQDLSRVVENTACNFNQNKKIKEEVDAFNNETIDIARLKTDQNFRLTISPTVTSPAPSNALTDSDTDVQSKWKDSSLTPQSHKHRVIQHSNQCSPLINPLKRSRFISQMTKRKVFQRAGGSCEFIGSNGRRCNSKHQLEWDHVIPWSQGGGNEETSLRVYCRTHNQYRTKETHGFWYRSFKK